MDPSRSETSTGYIGIGWKRLFDPRRSETSTGDSRGDDGCQRVVNDWKQKSPDRATDGGVSGVERGLMVESKAEQAEEQAEEALASLSKATAFLAQESADDGGVSGEIVPNESLAYDSDNVERGLIVERELIAKAEVALAKLRPKRSETSTGDSRGDDRWQNEWQRAVNRRKGKGKVNRKRDWKQKPADLATDGGKIGSIANGRYNVLREVMVESKAEQAEEQEEQAEEALASLAKAAAKIDPSHLADFLAQESARDRSQIALLGFYFYLEAAFSQVSSVQWLKISPLSKLIQFPLSHIPSSVYQTSADWISKTGGQFRFVLFALDGILSSPESQVAKVFELAMVLRCNPDALTPLLPMLMLSFTPDKLPLILWVMAQASQGDLSAGLYAWAHNLLPLVGSCSRPSMDLILQFVEIILSNPEARTILVNRPARKGEPLIPPSSFEILVRLTFPASSAREKATRRFEAVYPLLKEVALAPAGNAVQQIFTLSLNLLAGEEGNPGLAKEAAAIAVRCVTENVDCFKLWDILYKEHLEASVSLLRKLVDEWTPELLSSPPYHALTVNRTLNSFRLKNKLAIIEGGACYSLIKEAETLLTLLSK